MKSYNWKKGIIFFIVCILVGGLAGLLLSGLEGRTNLQEVVAFFKAVAPNLFIVGFILGIIGLAGYFYFNAKLKQDHYRDEEDSFYEKHEKAIELTMMCSTLCAVVNFTAFGVNLFYEGPMMLFFIINVGLAFGGEVAYIALVKKVRPELNADPLQIDFNRSYFDKLDEYEKNKVGKASFNTITAMMQLYIALFICCYVLSLLFNISPIICLPIGIIWAAQTILMTYYSNKKNKNK